MNETPEVPIQVGWTLVDTSELLSAAIADLAGASGPFAIDTERASGYTYGADAYLVQIHRAGAGIFLADPRALSNLAPLGELLASDEWILHAASQDLPCLRMLGFEPPKLFDTELAARLLGYERVGLGALVDAQLDIHLAKAHSAADWSTRPLPNDWLEYAALDVAFLPELRTNLRSELEAAGRLEWAEAEFEFARVKPEKPPLAEPWRKLSGSQSLKTGRQRAIAKSLWEARDSYAREHDIAPGRLFPDASIIAAATAKLESLKSLAMLKTFRGRATRRELPTWWAAIQAGQRTDELPGPRKREPGTLPHHRGWGSRFPEAAARLAAARSAVTEIAEELSMPVEQLISPDAVRRLAWDPPDPPTAEEIASRLGALDVRPWQIEQTAPKLAQAFVETE